MEIGFIGAGKVGFSLGRMFVEKGLSVTGYFSRNPESAGKAAEFTGTRHFDDIHSLMEACDVLFLTVPDDAIASVWEEVRSFRPAGKIICHCSGSVSSTVFNGIEECGAFGYSVHPLLAVSDRYESFRELPKALFTIEGAKEHLNDISSLLSACGCRFQIIDASDKVRYHAAAVLASNLMVGLADCAFRLLQECGFSEEASRDALAPLMTGNLRSVLDKGPAGALTGPIERNDVQTVKKHLDALASGDPEILEVYRVLSVRTEKVAERKHPDRDASKMRDILSGYPVRGQNENKKTEVKRSFDMKKTVPVLQKMKLEGKKISMLTTYDYTTACLVEAAGIDTILVGDSLGMTMMGYDDTLPVTMDDMIHHTRCVTRGAHDTFVIGDMPFMSYQTSVDEAVYNAGRFLKEGRAQAVKLEGGAVVCPQIRAMVEASIPVCAHLGLTPQSVNAFGGFKVQGKNEATARKLIEDAKKIEDAGAFMVVLECVPAKLASLISKQLTIPTIGIGAGNGCDGQVLVYQDMLAMTAGGFKPKFVRQFGQIGTAMVDAFKRYDEAVKSGEFPAAEHTFKIDDELVAKLEKEYGLDSPKVPEN